MKINKELLKGSTSALIMTLLSQESMYGYQIIKKLDQKSNGIFQFKEGTLYPILHSLETKGMIESYWVEKEGSRKRKYYTVTKKGNKFLKEKQEEWVTFRSAIDKVLWEGAV